MFSLAFYLFQTLSKRFPDTSLFTALSFVQNFLFSLLRLLIFDTTVLEKRTFYHPSFIFAFHTDFAMASCPASGFVFFWYTGFYCLFPPPYFIEQYIAQKRSSHDVNRLIVLQNHPRHLCNLRSFHSAETAGGAWLKPWKH